MLAVMSWLGKSHVERNGDGMRSDGHGRCGTTWTTYLMSTSVSPGNGNGALPTDPTH
jgi:hypothetical protein